MLRCAKLWSLLASNTMKSSLSSFHILVLAAALLVLKPFTVSAETFTEGVRVSPDTVKLKTGEYVWEPERAPEGPLLIVASTTEQVAYVYRNGIRIARSSVSTRGLSQFHEMPAASDIPYAVWTVPGLRPATESAVSKRSGPTRGASTLVEAISSTRSCRTRLCRR